MSEFVADLRVSKIPTVCEDFDNDQFVAEIRPCRFSSSSAMEMDVPGCNERFGPSDEHLQGLLTSSHFSTDQITELIRSSTQTLIKKLLFGHRIAHIDGQVKVTLEDEQQSPIVINFNDPEEKNETSAKSKSPSPATLISEELNVTMRRSVKDSADYHQENFLQSSDFTPVKFMEQPCLNMRRGSDDSGYGGKHLDMETSRLVPSEERLCSSVDSVYTMLESDLRYQREPSCETVAVGPTSPASESWEELDDEGSPLIIDESYDPEAQPETSTAPGQGIPVEKGERQVEAKNVAPVTTPPTSHDGHSQHGDHDACCADSQRRSPSLPVDLSGDSEDPRGSLTPRAQSLVLCSNLSPQGLMCRLCHVITANPEELSRHAAQTHNLFACVQCFQSFTAKSHLENHACLYSRETSHNSIHPSEYFEAHVKDSHGSDQLVEQVLDLSVKKRPEISGDVEACDSRSNDNVDVTRALSSRPGQNVSRDGYGQPGPDSPLLTIGGNSSAHLNQTMRQLSRVQSFDNMGSGLVSIKVEPDCTTLSSPVRHFSLSGSQNVPIIPIKTEDQLARSRVEEVIRPVEAPQRGMSTKRAPVTHGKPSIRFSPYDREKLTELTARFFASRKVASTTLKRDSVSAESNTADKEMSVQPAIPAQATAKVNDKISCEVSMSETALKNRVNAFVKNGGHQVQTESSANAKSKVNSSSTAVKHADVRKASNVSHGAVRNSTNGNYTCGHEGCGEEFACFQALEHHSVDSHGRYLCEHCGKTFTARPNRDRHVRYHTGERPYKCDLCPMAFFRGDDLKYHRTTRHPAAEPFVCKRCNRNFTWNRDLERHQRHCRCKA